MKVENSKKDAENQALNKEIEKLKAELTAKVMKTLAWEEHMLDRAGCWILHLCVEHSHALAPSFLYLSVHNKKSLGSFLRLCSTTGTEQADGHGHKGCRRNA